MYKLKFSLFCLSLFVSLSSFSQRSLKAIKSEANEYFRVEEYHHALPLFLKVDSLQPNDPEVSYRIGVCYYQSEYKLKGLSYFEKAKKLMHKHHELDLMLGRLYHLHHDFDKAIEHYNHHKKYINTKSAEGQEAMAEVALYITQCENAKELIKKPVDYEITNLGPNINSKFSDYAPVISADESELIFTSKRNTTTGGGYDEINDCYFEDVYIALKSGGGWGEAKNIGAPINTNGHDAAIGLSPDGQKLFVYKPQPGSRLAGDIYVSDEQGEQWKAPVKLGPTINTDYWESHATISADEQTLYYTSDKPGGKGHKDIYVSKRMPSGEWSVSEDLSTKINTEFDEDGPFLHPDGKTLYFSSKGHKSMGGYDIFKTVYNEEKREWSEPENVGYPLNTADDDLFIVWSADGTRAYFASIRADTYGEKDIYMAKRKEVSNFVVVLKGHVVDKTTKKPIAATITVHNLTSNQPVGVLNSNSATGKYVVVLPVGKNFSVTAEAPGYVFNSEHVEVPEPDKFLELEKLIELEPVGKKDQVATLNNVFFDYDKATLRPQSKTELDRLVKLLQENKEGYVEIAAHTDSVANNTYNAKLSSARAKSVVDYLIQNGIDSTKLLPIGYGEDFPVASNTTSEGRQLNRRCEFIFVDKFLPNKEDNIKRSFYYRKEKEELGVERTMFDAAAVKLVDVPIGKSIIIKSNKYRYRVYFSKQANSLDTNSKELVQLLTVLKENKGQTVQITGHVDKANDAAQAALAKKHMVEIAKYFERKGIPATSISTLYMGDKSPYAGNTTAEGRKLNRRVEVFINLRNLNE